MAKKQYKILIADDSQMNRALLAEMLSDECEIMEAEDGVEALELVERCRSELSLVLLDIVMPELDGLGVLGEMQQRGWTEYIPVMMISAESGSEQVERAFELGAKDFIGRPFNAHIVKHRVENAILLYARQRHLVDMVVEHIYEKEQQSNMMIDALGHIVEFRNEESGFHIRHVHTLTEIILRELVKSSDQYRFSAAEINTISTASALHDVGKISIPEEILNKPGRLTEEEFAIMKTHSEVGAEMLRKLPIYQDSQLIQDAYQICRWHHERYDGSGYPDGLKGDEIPIIAQVVSLADVYDALTSNRVYKKAISHEKAVEMILNGECGAFQPLLLECLKRVAPQLPQELKRAQSDSPRENLHFVAEELFQKEKMSLSSRMLQMLEHERMKFEFYDDLTEEIRFEYTASPPMVRLSTYGAKKLGITETLMNPSKNKDVIRLIGETDLQHWSDILRSTSPGQPQATYECMLEINGQRRWFQIIAKALWSEEKPPRYTGAIGKAVDIHDSRLELAKLRRRASSDGLTNLLNRESAAQRIQTRLRERPEGQYALAIMDLDMFKSANDNYGHLFGDRVLQRFAERLRKTIRGGDIVARVGGDEFLVFLEYKTPLEPIISRIFNGVCGDFEGFPISVSIGVAEASQVGPDYTALFQAADRALYSIKRGQRDKRGAGYRLYDPSLPETGSSIVSDLHETKGDEGL